MIKKNKTLVLIVLLQILAMATYGQEKPSIKKMSWLVGNWKGMASGQPFYEAWRQVGASELRQYGIKITPADTTISEIGKIQIAGDSITYGDGQMSWTLDNMSTEEMVFVNRKINFPRTIVWKKMANGHWYCLLKTDEQKIEYDIEQFPALAKAVDRWIKINKKS